MNQPDKPSLNFIDRVAGLARSISKSLQPTPDQLSPFYRTTMEEDLDRVNRLSGPPRPFEEYVNDFVTAVDEIRNNRWPFRLP